MRAIQGAIAGVGLALVAVIAVALLIGNPGSMGSNPAGQQSKQAAGPPSRLGDGPAGPAEPVDAAKDTSVGTLPPPPDASRATQLISRDLLAPPDAAPDSRRARTPADGKTLAARKARPAQKPDVSGQVPAFPEDFTFTRDGWEWDAWNGTDARSDDGDDCRRDHRRDRQHDCDDHDWSGWRD
ncbi:hypothetical protein [Nocardioides panzhihuensis]|uniref:Uncharacterized protein n=1 Tax=Nocardioides panzhihuensis TaxID=860243 RepID=A0A7Z0DHW3_9ACTN|nr:hypothetical protein [Nocardioides panzhihuensis]NYI75601.1 hypothetical protein [Nocardioides panzhihuensis]